MLHPQVGKHGTAEIIYDIGPGTMVTDSVEIAVITEYRAVRADPAVVSRKRVFDVIVASLLLVVFAPFMAVGAAFVRFVSPGPALYRQERIGWHGRPFCILKLRTMHVSAAADASTVTRSNDVRLIRGGRWLRKFKIDELPQILNVLGGSMSLVGPRPTVREDVERMTPAQRQRLLVRPGLTGLAQIRGNTALPWPRRVELDLDYISTLSLSQDLRIIAESASQILTGRADTHPAGEDEWS